MANVKGTFYSATTQRRGVTPVSPPNAVDDPQDPLEPVDETSYLTLSDTADESYVGKNGFTPVVNNESQLVLEPLPNGQADGLISGGIVQWTGTGYQFNVSSALARFQGVFPLQSDFDILTLTTADATNPRIDLFILQILFDGDGIPNGMEADFITGTPAATPAKPQINPATQIELTQVLVPALSTTPTLTEEIVYDENTEWTGTSSGTGTASFNSAVNPYVGTVSVETTNIQNGFYIQFNNGSEIDRNDYQTLGFFLDLKNSMPANQNLYITFLNGSLAPVSGFTLLNFDKSSTIYQFVGIALSSISFTSDMFQYIRFSFVRTGGSPTYSGYFLDIVKFEGGINPPVQFGTFLSLGDTPNSYSGQGGKTVAVKADESGLEFVTPSGGASTFLALTDTPSTYVAQANKFPRVNVGETALIFDTVSPYDLDQEGATNGQVLTWVTANSRFEPVTPSGGSSNWTVSGSDIYRNSQVTIGQTTIISADLGVKQVNINSAFRIDGLAKSTRRTIQSIYESSTLRYTIDNWGVPIWRLWSGVSEAGALAFSTPTGRVGILTATTDAFTLATRGYIDWDNVNHNCYIGVNNTTRFYINNGFFGLNTSGTSAQTIQIRAITGQTIIFNSLNIAGTGIFAVYESGYAYAQNVQTANFTGTTARQWKLGERKAAAVAFDATQYLTVQVNGVTYNLALAV